ncbi:hypothetical protein [Uliginosibacterium sediminicola]|uniref:Uncharacterized protein n=1 Tax=Uliginosibacterium sediminicola TaxID=2024550 RepID=A0ABU9Z178_9RHOO
MKRIHNIALIGALGVLLALPALAQNGGMGMGNGMKQGMGQGDMQGNAGMRGQRQLAQSLMTPEERSAHQIKMRQLKSYDECTALQTEQHALMVTRAKEKGITLPTPRQNGCDNMKARGFIN